MLLRKISCFKALKKVVETFSWLEIYKKVDNCVSMRFEVLTVVTMRTCVFWVVAPCNLVEAF
jgi:hypothetical protein